MSDYPRRRRLEPEPPKGGGGLPLFPLVILVILGGLLLGGLLTRFFGNPASGTHAPISEPSFTPLPGVSATIAAEQPTPTPSPTPSPTPQPSAAASASPKPKHSPRALASVAAVTASPTSSPTSSAAPTPSLAPARQHAAPPVIIITPSPAPTGAPPAALASQTPQPAAAATATATPVLITGAASRDHAAAIVRAYIGALANGDTSTATSYLASGIPDESFINPNVNVTINDLRTARNSDGSVTVTAEIGTSKGNYLETFTLRGSPYGLQITDRNATKM